MLRRFIPLIALAACGPLSEEEIPSVTAVAETEAVTSEGDAADDPAIWINSADPLQSRIFGTDKKAGLYSYDLSGAIRQFLPAGELNNVDLRQGVVIGEWTGDIAAASNRTNNTISLFIISGGVAEASGAFPSAFDEPYGLCMGAPAGEALVFVAYKTGDLVMYRLAGPGAGEEAGRLKLASQLEGCVFDDETGTLYVGEENTGVWKASYRDGALAAPRIVAEIGKANGMKADVEGLALYKTGETSGYLIASSQGNNSYALFDREGENAFLGRFRIAGGETVDGAEETDGIEATSASLGADFPAGLLVVQDGFNDPSGSPQNFKIVDWRAVEAALVFDE